MRAVLLVLLLVLAGCAHRTGDEGRQTSDDQAMPNDFAGTLSYENGSVPPPYHYRWTVTFDDDSAVVEWRPGYTDDGESWQETAQLTAAQRVHLYDRLRDLGVFDDQDFTDDGMVGGPGGHYQIAAGDKTYDPGSLGGGEDSARLLEDVADAVQGLVPDDVWQGLRDKQDDWAAHQPK